MTSKDGLKIYTTIDSRMQLHAEEAAFRKNFSESKKIKTLHFVGISDKETQRILTNAMKASNRWSVLKSADKSDEEIIKSFSVKQNDRIYMKGEKDTIMTQWTPFVITNIFYNLDLWLWSLKLVT
jgi:penicillin-binding protein 1A